MSLPPDAVRLIAFYLPQFHPIPENNRWWGPGFTEWTNVAKARPLFPGHYQPHIPADLGFYDLRLPETRAAQAALAREYGVAGFCYWHYWFDGKRLLERPFNEVLASGEPDFPFCLAWANEPWSRRWHGRPEDVLQPQHYGGPESDRAHIRWLLGAFQDRRYLLVEGKPLFLVYRPEELPEPRCTTEVWREEATRAGLPGLHLVAIESHFNRGWDPIAAGFDAGLLFQPRFDLQAPYYNGFHKLKRVWRRLRKEPVLYYYDYQEIWPLLAQPDPAPHRRYESVCPGWDNTARRGEGARIFHNSTPAAYKAWLCQAIERAQQQPAEHRLVFINAWNEWAEGNHLEPDLRFGHGYLEATREALCRE
jgi:lipopolysaccharide biosynthesis protein